MAIKFVTGKMGGGKSYYAVRQIIEELVNGKRTIITNLDIQFSKLQTIVSEKRRKKGLEIYNIMERIAVIEEEEVKDFYLYRFNGREIYKLELIELKGEDYKVANYQQIYEQREAYNGTLYALDEIHLHFHNSSWQKTGMTTIHYVTQHRKLNDQMIMITQELSQMVRAFRNLGQEFHYIENFAFKKKGIFVHTKKFRVDVFYYPPSGERTKSAETYGFVLEKPIAECYRTESGLGIQGQGAEEEKPKKGLPIWTAWAALAAVVLGVPTLMVLGTSAGNKAVNHKIGYKGENIENVSENENSFTQISQAEIIEERTYRSVLIINGEILNCVASDGENITGQVTLGDTGKILFEGREIRREIKHSERWTEGPRSSSNLSKAVQALGKPLKEA